MGEENLSAPNSHQSHISTPERKYRSRQTLTPESRYPPPPSLSQLLLPSGCLLWFLAASVIVTRFLYFHFQYISEHFKYLLAGPSRYKVVVCCSRLSAVSYISIVIAKSVECL